MARVWNKREREARRLLAQCYATMRELLTVSFGEWPLKGLDINPAVSHDQFVELRVIYGGENFRLAGSASPFNNDQRHIRIGKWACIFLPAFLTRSTLATTMGHEALHVLQGDNYYRARDIYGREAGEKIRRSQQDMDCRLIMSLCTGFNANARHDRSRLDYLRRGEETQAYFHEALGAGYREWGKMPGNREELWQALVSLGLEPPQGIKEYLGALPVNAAAYGFRKNVRYQARRSFCKINKSFAGSQREFFWHNTLPALYADLIEMYGDQPGRERFGFGPNTRASAATCFWRQQARSLRGQLF